MSITILKDHVPESIIMMFKDRRSGNSLAADPVLKSLAALLSVSCQRIKVLREGHNRPDHPKISVNFP